MLEWRCKQNYAKVRKPSNRKGWAVIKGNPMNETVRVFKVKRDAISFAKRWIDDCKERVR